MCAALTTPRTTSRHENNSVISTWRVAVRRAVRGHLVYVALEGIDGSGKSSALPVVASHLREAGHTVSAVRYTAKDGRVGKLIRYMYDDGRPKGVVRRTVKRLRALQATLYATNGRLNLLRRQRGTDILLCDRSSLSGYASHLGRVPRWWLYVVEPFYAPDLVVFFDVAVADASARLVAQRGSPGYEEDVASLEEFCATYEQVFRHPPMRLRRTTIKRIDASGSRESVVAQAIAAIADIVGAL
jgi:thymidylate kinase